MHRRKIQLVAGTTYSVSLPKAWVKKNNLKKRHEIIITENNNRSLVISPYALEDKKISEISLNVDDYLENIDQIIFAIYYLGAETINLFSKKGLAKEAKAKIRKTITHMSGTEISYEDKNKITLKVLLDKSKIDINQILYRISLIVDLSISNLLEDLDIVEIRMNENEIDRLFHLMTKIVSLALIDSKVLLSSRIRNVSLIPSYFLISKKLENIGDNINHLCEYLHKCRKSISQEKLLELVKKELNRSTKHLLAASDNVFRKISNAEIAGIKKKLAEINDKAISDYLEDIIRFTVDIEEEIINISFYRKMIKDSIL
ncbi:hypothetical protein GF323_04830 [Candidatus Woesearchaeota archaeon]|nr:hypothetical protein [Candidatus Woesearchaeota archaeon]